MLESEFLLNKAPRGKIKLLVSATIALFLIHQVVYPLRYYVMDNAYKERFSWRFFSSIAMRKYEYSFEETVREGASPRQPLASILQLRPMKMFLFSHDPDVVSKFLRWRCTDPAIEEVRYRGGGTNVDGGTLAPIHMRLTCGDKQIQDGDAGDSTP